MGALDRFLRRGRQQDGYKPMIKRLEAAMLSACRASGASVWYVPDDLYGTYQDSTGATAVTVAGQPIGRINDKSSTLHVSQSTAGNRPVLSKNSINHYYMTFDGNDSISAPSSVIGASLSQPYTMIAWGRVGALGAARRLVGDSARSLGIATTGKPSATNHGVVNSNAATTMVAGQLVILESTWDGATLAVHVNGVKEGEIASAAPTAPAGATTIGQRGSGVEYWNEAISGVVVCPAVMTDAQRLAVRKFAAAQMGLTL